jgi:alkylation response protein AidB-like acyl-CoA dehydrogenase
VTRADQREPGLDRWEHNPAVLRRDCELWPLSRVQSIFGGTTEILKEIIGRGLGL